MIQFHIVKRNFIIGRTTSIVSWSFELTHLTLFIDFTYKFHMVYAGNSVDTTNQII